MSSNFPSSWANTRSECKNNTFNPPLIKDNFIFEINECQDIICISFLTEILNLCNNRTIFQFDIFYTFPFDLAPD